MGFDVATALVDDELKAEGSRFYLDDEAYLLVRSSEYKPFRIAHQKGMFGGGGKLGSEKQISGAAKYQAERLPDMIAKHLICGWHGLEMDGKPLPYSDEMCQRLAPKWEFIHDILEFANERANFVRDQKEEAGNALKLASNS